jgi:hypothetical protein
LRKFHPSENEVEVAKILTKLSPCIVWNECDAVLAEMGSVKMKRGSHFSRPKGKRPKKDLAMTEVKSCPRLGKASNDATAKHYNGYDAVLMLKEMGSVMERGSLFSRPKT